MADEHMNAPVVLRFRDGTTERCSLAREFSPRDSEIEAVTADGGQLSVAVEDLKAVFFVKNPRRRDAEAEMGSDAEGRHPEGAFAKVEFFDGEILRGHVQHYSVDHTGFFLRPSNRDSNNEKVFVVASALQTVSLEG